MVADQNKEKSMPEIDETWWESVLAEEERYTSHNTKQINIDTPVSAEDGKSSTNWEEVRELYHQDRIVEEELAVQKYPEGPEDAGYERHSHPHAVHHIHVQGSVP